MSNQPFNFAEAPHSQQAEEALLGALLINGNAFDTVVSFLNWNDFFFRRHQYIYQAMERIRNRKEPIEPVVLCHELEGLGLLKDIGGPAFLTQLMNDCPTSVHAEVYAHIIERASIRRKLMQYADETKARALDEEASLEDVLADTERGYQEKVLSRVGGQDHQPISKIFSSVTDQIEFAMNHPGDITGVCSGLYDLDKITMGLNPENLYVIAGRPGMGKSALALKYLVEAVKQGKRVAMFSLEMGVEQLAHRIIAMETDVPYTRQKSGKITPQEWEKILEVGSWADKLDSYLFLDDVSNLNPAQLRSKAWTFKRLHGIDVVIIDYLQLMSSGTAQDNRTQEIGYISMKLKQLAREMKIPVLALAQLSRSVEQRQDKRPILSDLRDSGQIEQDADVIMFLYRDSLYNEASEFPNQADIIVAKHRNGPTGVASVYYDKQSMHFVNMARRHVDLSKDAGPVWSNGHE